MILLAALLALDGGASLAQTPRAATIAIQPAPDSPVRRLALRDLVTCVAESRTSWARQTLALPYLSEAQAGSAAEVLNSRDNCLPGEEVDMTFRTSTLVASLAEHFIRQSDAGGIARTAAALNTATPLNGSEDFALCVAARDAAAARDLALSVPGSPAETQAAQRLGARLPDCVVDGENPTVDLQSLRALVATALYRASTADARN